MVAVQVSTQQHHVRRKSLHNHVAFHLCLDICWLYPETRFEPGNDDPLEEVLTPMPIEPPATVPANISLVSAGCRAEMEVSWDGEASGSSLSFPSGAGVFSGRTNWPTEEDWKLSPEPGLENGVPWGPANPEIGDGIWGVMDRNWWPNWECWVLGVDARSELGREDGRVSVARIEMVQVVQVVESVWRFIQIQIESIQDMTNVIQSCGLCGALFRKRKIIHGRGRGGGDVLGRRLLERREGSLVCHYSGSSTGVKNFATSIVTQQMPMSHTIDANTMLIDRC
ncbi:hypothetical protein OGAPHI_003818 [Ogataea philodendri]|uniref:Uncharacterized protein n=1 Tax=Ogataea philodendri TaxID=1378263 RepID=A0A9P8T517_9ASCO|nr:uncharacterized protein OGAPHI_003818 [Ogataea philodendri]KAH3665630.1 hypothetical protein OGAPHI_003818 [Ogataea philodendri]